MTALGSFTDDATVALVGASGGIGRALLRLLESDDRIGRIYAFSRSEPRPLSAKTRHAPLDLADEASIAAAAELAGNEGPLDLVVVTTGVLHRGETLKPEKSMRDIGAGSMAEVFAINTIGPALVAKYFLPFLRKDAKTVFAALSARVGSIEDNRLGGWVSYRASKTALNMVLKTLSIEQVRVRPDSIVVALHPGTVATPLSKPFSKRVPEEQLFDAETAAARLLTVIDGLTSKDTGGFFAWDGQPIPY